MLHTIEAIVEQDGSLRLLEPVELPAGTRALVTILEGEASARDATLLSQPALAADWAREEEDEAWAHLTP